MWGVEKLGTYCEDMQRSKRIFFFKINECVATFDGKMRLLI